MHNLSTPQTTEASPLPDRCLLPPTLTGAPTPPSFGGAPVNPPMPTPVPWYRSTPNRKEHR